MGADGVRTTPDGKELSLRLFGRSDSPDSKKVVEFVKGWLTDIGIKVDVSLMESSVLGERITAGTFDMFEWGWIPDVDPDYILSIFTCGKRSGDNDGGTPTYNTSDSFYCDPAFDEKYLQQGQETDSAARQALVAQMQQQIYDDAPYVLTYYYDSLEAYRNDRFTDFTPQPNPGGALFLQFGTWSYQSFGPVGADNPDGTTTAASSSTNWGVIVAVVAGVLVLIGLIVFLSRRRRESTADDRE